MKLSNYEIKKLLGEASKRGFKIGTKYRMYGEKYKIEGALFIRYMYKFGQGTDDDAIDYPVINHKNGNGVIYNGKTNKWAKILK